MADRARARRWRATIFLTTQYLQEADQLADRVGVLDRGRLIADGTPAELKRIAPGGHISVRFADPATLDAAARLLEVPISDHQTFTVQVPSDGSFASLRALIDRLETASLAVEDLSIHTPDLDDVFFTLTGQPTTTAETPSGNPKGFAS